MTSKRFLRYVRQTNSQTNKQANKYKASLTAADYDHKEVPKVFKTNKRTQGLAH